MNQIMSDTCIRKSNEVILLTCIGDKSIIGMYLHEMNQPITPHLTMVHLHLYFVFEINGDRWKIMQK